MNLDERELREALGCFATGVCVITANPEGYQSIGITVNSFTSVSLDPPQVLWNLQNASELFETWSKVRHFVVNILHSGQQDKSTQYARKGDHILCAGHHVPGSTGAPLMPDTLASLECELEATYPSGDHVIVIGRVLNVHRRGPGQPLLFFGGAYRELQKAGSNEIL